MPHDLSALPKAHLHLHLMGAMRHSTMLDLAQVHGVALPPALTEEWPPQLSATDERGWFRFQRLYDAARSVLRTPDDVYRLLRETAEDERADGSGWLELQADPSGYTAMFGGITAFTELLLDAAATAAQAADLGIAIVIAANRTRHPLEARTLARLAAQFAGRGVVGFGLSSDERRGRAEEFAGAFGIAGRAGLLLVPHAGELVGPASVAAALDRLHADRIGHGVRSVEDPELVKRLAAAGVTLEVCPSSNVALGVWPNPAAVPVRLLYEAGVPIALAADDPLLFGRRLVSQYEIARDVHGFTPRELAELARMSVLASAAPATVRTRLLAGIDSWLTAALYRPTSPTGHTRLASRPRKDSGPGPRTKAAHRHLGHLRFWPDGIGVTAHLAQLAGTGSVVSGILVADGLAGQVLTVSSAESVDLAGEREALLPRTREKGFAPPPATRHPPPEPHNEGLRLTSGTSSAFPDLIRPGLCRESVPEVDYRHGAGTGRERAPRAGGRQLRSGGTLAGGSGEAPRREGMPGGKRAAG